MRSVLAALAAGLWTATLAAAQTSTTVPASTTTTLIGSTTTTLVGSTTTTVVTSTVTTVSSTTVTSTSVTTLPGQTCAQATDSKRGCRESCCSNLFNEQSADCNADGNCVESEYQAFAEQWRKAGLFYKFCQNPDDPNPEVSGAFEDVSAIRKTFARFNVDSSCQAYLFGCKKAARKHVRQCADNDRCVACCRMATVRWRAEAIKRVRARGGGKLCNPAIRCLKTATKNAKICRDQCRRTETCGQADFMECLTGSLAGWDVRRCYKKCANKCRSNDSYVWCLQACQGLSECGPYEECAASLDSTEPPGCLLKEPSDCVVVTTTTTSTSSSTTTSARTTTTSTTTSTTTTSPL